MREPCGDHRFNPSFLDAPKDCVIFGYFQTPLYFQSIAMELRMELQVLLGDAVSIPCNFLEKITKPGSVAVHVRRTDFLNIRSHQVCGTNYYREAMDMFRGMIDNPIFHIFSDDPDWCRATFTETDQEVIQDARMSESPLNDLHLMSHASHHIIANSTYSWWAAWLGEKPGQRVILPDRWFTEGVNAPVKEKMLPHWQTIPTLDFIMR
jgi:hypothetical protein